RNTQTLSLVSLDPQQLTAADGTINPANFTFLSYQGVAATTPAMFNDQMTFAGVTDAGPGGNGTFTLSVTLPTQPATTFTTLPIPASGATAADVLSALNAIPALTNNVAVADDSFGIIEGFDITFQGALTGVTIPVKFNELGGTVGQSFTFV